MELKGSVMIAADRNTATGAAATIAFQVANTAGGNAIDLTPGKTLIKYTDATQSKMFLTDSSSNGFTATGLGSADSDKLLEHGEVYESKLNGLETVGSGSNNLTNKLGVNRTFMSEVIPPSGAVLFIERTAPVSWDATSKLN